MLRRRTALLLLTLPLASAPALAQPPIVGTRWATDTLQLVGGEWEDRVRLRQLEGATSRERALVRALSSSLDMRAAGDTLAWSTFTPELHLVHNSELPFSQNDGLLWAGRGLSTRVRAGVAASWRGLRVVVLPEVAVARNADFTDVDQSRFYRPPLDTDRFSPFASPWNRNPVSADVPPRFGSGAYSQATLGQSAAWYEGGAWAAGASSENLWWGPGLRDALVMTNHAAGVPHVFLRTARPIETAIGAFEGRWIVGALTESDYFDLDPDNDRRSLSAAVVTYTPRWEPNVTLGAARAVYAPVSGGVAALGHALDVFGTFDRPASRPYTDTSFTGGRDQVGSLFARWVFPSAGWEVYGEYGRAERPANVRGFLTDPGHSGAAILGVQHARRVGGDARLRVQLEIAQMEQSTSYRYRPTPSWYTSRATPQGYTQRGQVIGAGIGPGSQHQWLAADYVARDWSVGAFVGRWRFNNDGMYAIIGFPPGTGWCEFDTTIYPGARGAYRGARIGLIQAEVIAGTRMNAFHQNNSGCPAPEVGSNYRDVRNRTLRLTVTPRVRW